MNRVSMRHSRNTFGFALLAVIACGASLAACGGSGSGTGAASVIPVNATKANGTVALKITIPGPSTQAAARRPAYVSASTQSLAVTILQGQTTVTQQSIGLTPSSNPNCVASGGATTCTITLGLAAGSYVGTFATYAGPVVSGAASGALLSSGQGISVVATAGATNTITATLDGVPASITIGTTGGSTITGTQAGGFTVPYAAQPLLIQALDAGGNVIIGPGAPTFSATATASKFTVTQPVTGTPNQITLAAAAGGTGTLSITASAPDAGFSCSTPGVVCTTSATISTAPHTLFVANQSAMTVYQSTDNVTWTLTATATYPASNPNQPTITVGPDGTAFVSDVAIFAGRDLVEYAPPYTGVPTIITNGVSDPTELALTSSGQLLVGDQYFLHTYAAPYTGSPTVTAFPTPAGATAIVVDSNNDAIVSTSAATWLLAPPYTSVTQTIDGTNGGGAALAANGTLFIGSWGNQNSIFAYSSPYTGTPTTIPVPSEGGSIVASSLNVARNGALWAFGTYSGGCPCNNYLFEFAPPITSSSTPAEAITTSSTRSNVVSDTANDAILATNSSTISIINNAGTTVGTVTNGIANPSFVYYLP